MRKYIWLVPLGLTLLLAVYYMGFYMGRNSGDTIIYEKPDQVRELVVVPESLEEPEEPREPTSTGPVNINTATQAELETLPGIGPTLAQRIIQHRETYGPFRLLDEIKDVPGIGDATFAEIQPMITVEETP